MYNFFLERAQAWLTHKTFATMLANREQKPLFLEQINKIQTCGKMTFN